jgi:hypothetical protein
MHVPTSTDKTKRKHADEGPGIILTIDSLHSLAMIVPVEETSPAPRPAPPFMHLQTSSFGFAIWWLVLLLLHVINAGYYLGAALVYRAMRWTNVDYQLFTYSIGITSTQYTKVATIHEIVAALHLLLIIAMLIGSLQARRLVFLPTTPPWLARISARLRSVTTMTVIPRRPVSLRSRVATWMKRCLSSCLALAIALFYAVFGRRGYLGVDGVYFDHLHLARELVETTLQTIQVYRMSYLLPRVWLIRFYVVLLIANCWSTPIVHRYYGNRHVDRRMMSLLCDAVLDMVSSVGVSFWIFATYAPQYTDPIMGFPFDNWFDDVWFTNMQQEFQMMMVVSWADMASRLVFAVGLLQCTKSIKNLLTPAKPPPSRVQVHKIAIVPAQVDGVAAQQSISSKPTNKSKWTRAVEFMLEKAGPMFFVLLGFAILAVHIVAETRQLSSKIPCQLMIRPWFVNKPACSLVELDCHQLGGVSGSLESMDEAWHTYDFSVAARLFVRHCSQLEMPVTIQRFHQLTSLKLYNTTIASWPKEAAFTAVAHEKMRAVFAIRTNFSDGQLPAGLLDPEFPKSLLNFVTSATNLHTLPDNLHDLWPVEMALSFEHSALQTIPPTLLKINPMTLSFAGSRIATVPAELFESTLLGCVLLSYTDVQELPRVVPNPSRRLYLMFLEGSNVSTFWSWMEPFIQQSVWYDRGFFNAYGSRFCIEREEIAAGKRRSFSITTAEPGAQDLASIMDVSTPEKLHFAQVAVLCEPVDPFYFPLEIQDGTSALYH